MRGTEPLLVVNWVEALTVRAIVGDGDQVELQIRTRKDDLTIRLVPRAGRGIRITNLRRRDKRSATKMTVPFLNGEEER